MADMKLFIAQVIQNSLKEWKRLFRNKESMFFTFLFPIVMLLLMGTIFGGQSSTSTRSYQIGVVNLDSNPVNVNGTISDNGTLGATFRDVLNSANFTVYDYTEIGSTDANGSALYLLYRGELDGILIIPENFTECLSLQYITDIGNGSTIALPVSVTIDIIVDPTDQMGSLILGQTLRGVVSGFSEIYQQEFINNAIENDPLFATYAEFMEFLSKPIESRITEGDVAVVDLTWIHYLIPGILSIVVIWAGLVYSSQSIAKERETGTLKRLVMSPVSSATVLLGTYFASLVTILVSVFLAFAVGVIIFQVTLVWDVIAICVLTIVVSFSAIGPGLIITSLARNPESAESILVIVAIPLQFFVGGMMPVEILPSFAQSFANALPYTKYSHAVQDIAIRGLSIFDVMDDIAYMLLCGFILMFLGILAYSRALKSL